MILKQLYFNIINEIDANSLFNKEQNKLFIISSRNVTYFTKEHCTYFENKTYFITNLNCKIICYC